MISTGTFLEISIKAMNSSIPIILGRTIRGYLVCLPDHEVAFELKDNQYLDTDSFTASMDGASAELVTAVVKQALGLLAYCRGDSKWIQN
jgi:hypothetical protein